MSVIVRRFLKNYMRVNIVEPSNMQISRDLLKSVKASRQRYQIHVEDQRKGSRKKEKSDELIQVENELKAINSECTTFEKVIATFNAQIFEKLKSAAKTTSNELRCKMVVVEMDALKRKCDEKEDQLVVLRKRAKELRDKKNNFNAQHAQQLIDINAFCFSRLQFCTVLRYKKIYCSKV